MHFLKTTLFFLSFLILSCNNVNDSKHLNEVSKKSILLRRAEYLEKKSWISPEDMQIMLLGFTPIKERGLWDETKRKQMFREKLTALNIPDSTISRLTLSAEKIIGGRTGQWNYEYIEARLKVYKSEMERDEAWKKIEDEYNQSQINSSHSTN